MIDITLFLVIIKHKAPSLITGFEVLFEVYILAEKSGCENKVDEER